MPRRRPVLLEMMTPAAPAATALYTFVPSGMLPRRTCAMLSATCGGKSPGAPQTPLPDRLSCCRQSCR